MWTRCRMFSFLFFFVTSWSHSVLVWPLSFLTTSAEFIEKYWLLPLGPALCVANMEERQKTYNLILRSLSSLWSGSGCILGWFYSPVDIEARTTIPPLHTSSSTQMYLPGVQGPPHLFLMTLSAKGLPAAQSTCGRSSGVPPPIPVAEYSIEIRLSTWSVLAEEVWQVACVISERIVTIHSPSPWAQAVTGVWSQILLERTKRVMGRRSSQGTANTMSYM